MVEPPHRKNVSNIVTPKLPPFRDKIPKNISFSHERFAHDHLLSACCARRDHLRIFPRARSKAGASANRLLQHPDVKATIAWIRACMASEFPAQDKSAYPRSAEEIGDIFRRLNYWRRFQL